MFTAFCPGVIQGDSIWPGRNRSEELIGYPVRCRNCLLLYSPFASHGHKLAFIYDEIYFNL